MQQKLSLLSVLLTMMLVGAGCGQQPEGTMGVPGAETGTPETEPGADKTMEEPIVEPETAVKETQPQKDLKKQSKKKKSRVQ